MKRWDIYFCSDDSDLLDDVAIEVDEEVRAARDGERRIEVMRAEDHERIVAELKAELDERTEQLETTMERYRAPARTIATQERVIEKLRTYVQHRVDCICRAGVLQYSEECDCGLEAIEKGEA